MNLKPVIYMLGPQIAMIILIILTLGLINNRNILTINLTIISWVLVLDLYYSEPEPWRWVKKATKTATYTTVFLLILLWFSGWGILGLAAIIIVMAAWRIYQGWQLFDYSTTWMADTLFKGKKEEFDISKGVDDGSGKKL